MRVVPIAGSLAVNAALLVLVAGLGHRDHPAPTEAGGSTEPVEIALVDPPSSTVALAASTGAGGGTPEVHRARRQVSSGARPTASPWADVAIGMEDGAFGAGEGGTGGGSGGSGEGHGRGIGLGEGGGVEPIARVPAPLAPPPPSRARAAKLLHPTRETEVEEAELFVASVTVDEAGEVVGARMLRTHPGSRGETAASMIWQFRYAPALDDIGKPVRSTFEQTFAVR